MTPDQKYLVDLVSPLIDYPESIVCERSVDERGVLLTLQVSKSDMPKIIGKAGKISNSIRDLLHIWGLRNRVKLSLLIREPVI